MSDKVGIIIVSYNQKLVLNVLFKSLSEQSFNNFCIYFVDNLSSDGSVEYAKGLCHEYNLEAKFSELKENTGYTGGNNYGVRNAVKDGCKYCLILNSDTELDKNCLMSLLECIEQDQLIAVSGPILLLGNKESTDTTIQEYGANADFNNYTVRKNYPAVKLESEEKCIPDNLQVNFITGACFLIKSSVYEKIGLFEERYFAYGEEIDFFKNMAGTGMKAMVTKKAKVWHHHDWSSRNKQRYYIEYYLIQRNKYLYFRKNHLNKYFFRNVLKDILMYPVYLPWFIRICNFRLSLCYLKGTIDGLLNKSGRPDINL